MSEFLLTHYYVKYHHQDEADGKADGAEIGVLTVRGFGDQFLDHTDAATITPDAKPSSEFCSRTDISFRIKNTNAEPSIVPSSGINSPMINVVVIVCKDTKYF